MTKIKLSTLVSSLLTMTLLSGLFLITSCDNDDDPDPGQEPDQNIWEIVQDRDDLSSLEAELDAAGFATTLETGTSLTLFAPDNDAINQLLQTLQIDNLDPIKDEIAHAVLAYHVINEKLMASDLKTGDVITTSEGEDLMIIAGPTIQSGASQDAHITESDIEATNGVIHIVDYVLVPPSIGQRIIDLLGTVAQPIFLSDDFSILADAIMKADTFAMENDMPTLTSLLTGEDDLTVFAPSNAVFDAASLTADTFEGSQWYGIIAHHVTTGVYEKADLTDGLELTMASGGKVKVHVLDGAGDYTDIFLDANGDDEPDAEVVDAPLNAGNGIVHPIAGLLIPAS